jgi:hypothetical protein
MNNVDHTSFLGFFASVFFYTIGMVTLSSASFVVGIVAGLMTAAHTGIKIYKELKK